jgi:hypothetical protein
VPDPNRESAAWFESIYADAREHQGRVPWDRHEAHPALVAWLNEHPAEEGARALGGRQWVG